MKSKPKIFISQPVDEMSVNPEQQRERIKKQLEEEGYEVLDSFFVYSPNEEKSLNLSIYFLGKNISVLAEADAIFMCNGWEASRKCFLEYEVAHKYDLDILFEE